ncbi:MAG: hypothetical protein R3E64_09585 [Halioglobus sp.]
MKKIIDGMLFGIGFGVAFLATLYVGLGFVLEGSFAEPGSYSTRSLNIPRDSFVPTKPIAKSQSDALEEVSFSDLDIDDQIKYSTVIAVAEYNKTDEGKTKSIITDILKKDEGVTFHYDVGDEYRSYYPQERVFYGDGEVIFFTGSPASMRQSMSYHGERIGSLGDMPLRLLREKCDTPST